MVLALGCGDGESVALPQGCAVPIAESPTRGPADAWVTLVEFGDFQCPYCGSEEPVLRELDRRRPDLRWVFKHLPLSQHLRAKPASIAAECARDQGAFWPMHDLLYAHQDALADTDLAGYAGQLGLELDEWQDCYDRQVPLDRLEQDYELALQVHVKGTPTFFVNGWILAGARPLGDLLTAVDEAYARALESQVPAADYYQSLVDQGCN